MKTMSYLNCPRCGLSVEVHAAQAPVSCPRCRGRANVLVPMYETDRPRPPLDAHRPVSRAAA
jgi:DNA-directed RNA polymerase subunit RPC12/RpoP